MTFTKKHLYYLKRWLDVPVSKSQNRHRNEFVGMIQPSLSSVEDQRLAILDQYAQKDPLTGEMLKTPTGEARFGKETDKVQADVEYNQLLAEPVNITITQPASLEFAKKFIGKLEEKFNYEDGLVYTEICELLGINIPDEPTA